MQIFMIIYTTSNVCKFLYYHYKPFSVQCVIIIKYFLLYNFLKQIKLCKHYYTLKVLKKLNNCYKTIVNNKSQNLINIKGMFHSQFKLGFKILIGVMNVLDLKLIVFSYTQHVIEEQKEYFNF